MPDYFYIRNVKTGLVLDVLNNAKTDGPIIQYRAKRPPENADNQLWSFGYGLDTTIVNKNSGLVLDVLGNSTAPGAAIIQHPAKRPPENTENQRWSMHWPDGPDHRIYAGQFIVSSLSGQVLCPQNEDTKPNAKIVQAVAHTTGDFDIQLWTFTTNP